MMPKSPILSKVSFNLINARFTSLKFPGAWGPGY